MSDAGSGDTRGVVAPFLNQEREFLQSLGGLVQTHAEEIKQMVLAIRDRAEAPLVPDERATASSRPQRSAAKAPEVVEPASAAEIRERLQASEPPIEIGAVDEDDLSSEATPPIVVESGTEPVFSRDGAPATERRERSLRELFWGED